MIMPIFFTKLMFNLWTNRSKKQRTAIGSLITLVIVIVLGAFGVELSTETTEAVGTVVDGFVSPE